MRKEFQLLSRELSGINKSKGDAWPLRYSLATVLGSTGHSSWVGLPGYAPSFLELVWLSSEPEDSLVFPLPELTADTDHYSWRFLPGHRECDSVPHGGVASTKPTEASSTAWAASPPTFQPRDYNKSF